MITKPIPTQKQLDFMEWEFGLFFHFGIRTFYPGHKDWDGNKDPTILHEKSIPALVIRIPPFSAEALNHSMPKAGEAS